MKKLILAAVLYAAATGLAFAATAVPAGDAGAQRGAGGPFGVTVYVRGGFNGWGTVNAMSYDGGAMTYTATFSIDAGVWEFKVASDDWAAVDLGNADMAPTISSYPATVNAARTAFGNFSMDVAATGLYEFSLDVSSFTNNDGPYALTITAVPVPAAGVLLLSALGGLGFLRRRQVRD